MIPLGKYGAMRLTTARYYTPSGRSIQAKGIEPDIEVKPAKVEVLDTGVGFSEAEFSNALKNETSGDKNSKNADQKKAEAEELAKDYQLSRAIDLVKALGLYNEGLEDKRK